MADPYLQNPDKFDASPYVRLQGQPRPGKATLSFQGSNHARSTLTLSLDGLGYCSMEDKYLSDYLSQPRMYKHLRKAGLVTKEGSHPLDHTNANLALRLYSS